MRRQLLQRQAVAVRQLRLGPLPPEHGVEQVQRDEEQRQTDPDDESEGQRGDAEALQEKDHPLLVA
jgi:hypothetical protein